MRRNYAAALQNDAQQAINIWLTADSKQLQCLGTTLKLEPIPAQLARAAELLGDGHYMFKALKGRQFLFEGIVPIWNNPAILDTLVGRRGLALFNRSLEYEPNSPLTNWFKMLTQGFAFKNFDSAQVFLENAHRISPTWVLPFVNFSYMASYNGKGDLAKTMLDRAMAIDSTHPEVLNAYAEWLATQNRHDDALPFFEKYMANGGALYPCWFEHIGEILLRVKQPEKARSFVGLFETAIRRDTANWDALEGLGNFYFVTRQRAKAESIYSDIVARHLQDKHGYLFYRLGRFEEAEQLLLKEIHDKSNEMMAGFNLNWVRQLQGRWDEALELVEKIIQVMPRPNLYADRGIILAHIPGKMAEAEADFKKTEALKLDVWDVWSAYMIPLRRAQFGILKNEPEETVWANLEKAMENGYPFYHDLLATRDFDVLHQSPRWAEMILKYFPTAKTNDSKK
jgi:tetratricopeptide (TPR) repeat protein